MSHSMIDTTLPATRRDRRQYRNGCQHLTATSLNADDFAAALRYVDDESPMSTPRVKQDAAPIYTQRDRMAVRSWRGFEGLAATRAWAVETTGI
eukprot:CAMPEP_0119434346 /NCGR_PEP_ID=MMETSP1335-20130426/50622_1 /TAXON_ID=259385 /ORGANISM="Chrysoculter rhomboideus, Strain RCC1486" /LENGTH=93 /DNA_ID=CAMNT_0007460201 /DNA_START=112 /DNA_END=393 /DNA_ORIENTATION=+